MQLPRLSACPAHMASRVHSPGVINMPWVEHYGIYCTSVLWYMALVLAFAFVMEEEQRDGSYERILLPLSSACPPGAATSSCKTNTGRRCSVWDCLETVPGVHFSNSPCCRACASSGFSSISFTGTPSLSNFNLNSQDPRPSVNRTFSSPAILHSQSHPGGLLAFSPSPDPYLGRPRLRHLLLAMPRLRQRMRARRGVSRGRISGTPPLPLSELSSSSEGVDLTPPPPSRDGRRRGRSRGILAGRGRGRVGIIGDASGQPDAHSEPPGHSFPPDILAPPRQPLPSDATAHPCQPTPPIYRVRGTTIRQTTQNAELRFHCTSFNSIITALITVSLREEIPLSAYPPPPLDLRPNPSLHVGVSTEAEHQNMKSDSQEGKEDSSTGNEYACRVEEEPLSSENEG